MRPVSQNFLDSVTGSHRRVVEAYSILNDNPVGGYSYWRTGVDPHALGDFSNSPGRVSKRIQVMDGSVELDGTTAVRGTLTMQVAGVDDDGQRLWPDDTDGKLAPYGQEIFVRVGIEYSLGSYEWLSLGFFRISRIDQQYSPDGTIELEAQDRMQGIVDSRMLLPRQFGPETTYGGLVGSLVDEVYPLVHPTSPIWEFEDPAVEAATIGRNITVERDRYAALRDALESMGQIFYFDHRGRMVVKPLPDQYTPVWTTTSSRGGTLLSVERHIDRSNFYNAVVANGEGSDDVPPVTAVVVDEDPLSPTYFYGRFGQVPRFYFSPFITTLAQADSAARSWLAKYTGIPYSLSAVVSPNPALEPYDVINLQYPGRSEIHSVERMVIPLSNAGGLEIETKEKKAQRLEEIT